MKISSILHLAAIGSSSANQPCSLRGCDDETTARSGHMQSIANGATFDATKCIDDSILEILDSNNIPGASFAALKEGNIAYEQGYGTRDAPGVGSDDKRPTLPSTPFRIGSISKSMTATVLLILAQAGLLELDDVVFGETGVLHAFAEKYPPMDPRIYNVTIRQLLRHSAGFTPLLDLEDPFSDPIMSSKTISETLGIPGPATCKDTMQYMMNVPLLYSPDTGVAYSNFGYCILGRVIEAVTEMNYLDAAREWLLDPARVDPEEMYLGNTRIEDIPPDEAEYHHGTVDVYHGFCPGPSLFPEDEGRNVSCPYGSSVVDTNADSLGAWVASARQLVKVIAAISPPHCPEETCLLSKESRLELEKMPMYYPSNATEWYGLGWILHKVGNGLTWYHTGGIPGTWAFLMRAEEEGGYAYAIIFNGDNLENLNETALIEAGGLDAFVSDMAKCVDDDAWPTAYYESTPSTSAPLVSPNMHLLSLITLFVAALFRL